MRIAHAAALLFAGISTGIATGAPAEVLRDYCPERPGLNTPACIIDKGHLSVETGLADWTHDRTTDAVTDTTLIGATLLRYGLGDTVEAQIGWTPLGIERMRDRGTGAVDRRSRIGDVTLGVKANLSHPDGDGFALAILPQVTLPAGRDPIGAGTWQAGLSAPVTYTIVEGLLLEATPRIEAAADEEGHGRHLRYGSAFGIEYEISKALEISLEGEVTRDRDPEDHVTQALASMSIAWMPTEALQLDMGAVAGLNRASPDVEVYVGVSRRF